MMRVAVVAYSTYIENLDEMLRGPLVFLYQAEVNGRFASHSHACLVGSATITPLPPANPRVI